MQESARSAEVKNGWRRGGRKPARTASHQEAGALEDDSRTGPCDSKLFEDSNKLSAIFIIRTRAAGYRHHDRVSDQRI
jgi:hypothetical protein